MKPHAALLAVIVASSAIPFATLSAQPVYRCGNAYSNVPCPGGAAVDADDARTTAQRSESARVANDARRQAAEMRRERLGNEAMQRPSKAASLSGTPASAQPASAAASAARPVRKHRHAAAKPASDTPFTARGPRLPKP